MVTVLSLEYGYGLDLCIREREVVSYLHYAYVVDFVYQNGGNFIIPTVCLFSRDCLNEEENCITPTVSNLNIFYLLKSAKRIIHKLNKLMKSYPIYNKLQH